MGQADARGSRLGTDTPGGIIGTDERGRGGEGKAAAAAAAARVTGCQVRAPHHDGEVQSVERPVGRGVLLLPGLLHAGAGEILPSAFTHFQTFRTGIKVARGSCSCPRVADGDLAADVDAVLFWSRGGQLFF